MFVEILPNVFAPIIVEFTVRLGYAIFTVADADLPRLRRPAAVARLGPGHRDELRRGRRPATGGTVLFDALAIASLVVAVNLIADGIERVLER